uniref:Uncharacterized protein n=1 Tax=Candidatus Kentrum sp. FW TaxID=2126338 RepID=A0A450TAI9_9GAMM|nr:MAG: hypothetical protein BECKFW1821C_GA0114237_100466 [Candidatus Kentron sp. FW]
MFIQHKFCIFAFLIESSDLTLEKSKDTDNPYHYNH